MADRALGGVLPGGGTPVAPSLLNRLPPAINLGYRYMSGTGNKDLELPSDFKRGAVKAALSPGAAWKTVNREGQVTGVRYSNPNAGPIAPGKSRLYNSYGGAGLLAPGYDTAGSAYGGQRPIDRDKDAAPYRYTLGRYTVHGQDDTYKVQDTFDLVNEIEDPDLVSPGREPIKVIKAAALGLTDPSQFLRAYAYARDTPMRGFPVEFEVPRSEVE